MRESIFADDRLVERSSLSDYVVYRLARAVDLSGIYAGSESCHILSGTDRHYYLFERCVAGPFAQTVDCTFHLPCPSEHAGQSVCSGHAQIVMTVD